ncbi:deoxyribodipyrimidine photo-lyase Phr [Peptoclostridium acidaminophilum DSM 3953]|uniref:Deoxyribodipyrimidine photo-lyase n=1 Tax=Peptoclostridium acidaminophilum DSM 3953 TaxID=1286171 RepID=W8T2S6_PEPAC|nr:deoxyribodipyrimidine photo-lyase [Peptoclostridium acidaminophilum]AHM56049.1 deoxyribodipyrimidine photo-lyase Phr [Peptoclostridium acidaminophilum DSM 3953]
MISQERVKILNDKNVVDNPYVVYWMQSSQRAEYNHALEYAIHHANSLKKPLIVYFGITDFFPEANERHYYFMLEGLKEVKTELANRNIRMLIRRVSPEIGALEISSLAALMIVDRGYLRIERQWRDFLAQNAVCPVIQVETNVIVPVESASTKEEYSAATFRAKINKVLDSFISPLNETTVNLPSTDLEIPFVEFDVDDIESDAAQLEIDKAVRPVSFFKGGTSQAKKLLEDFISKKLPLYSKYRNEPGLDYSSEISPYLHFGQISPLYIFRRLVDINQEDKKDFLEELIVRRELSMNFIIYNEKYDSYEAIPSWARSTLENHAADDREYLYALAELEESKTHDLYWNAAQKEMVLTGKMHGYMRMYWGKKILEWSATPEDAFKKAIYLNNKYCLDGRDPNSFAGVAWCFGKHDRPWKEREIFGTVRYMNSKGLDRKFDMNKYLDKIAKLQ